MELVARINQKLQTRRGTWLEMAVGTGLLILAIWVWPSPDAKRTINHPVSESTDAGTASVEPSAPTLQQRYRLSWEMSAGHWSIAPLGGGDITQVSAIPGPRGEWRSPGYVSVAELRQLLLQQLRDWQMVPSPTEREQLLRFQLQGEAVFTADMLTAESLRKAPSTEVLPHDSATASVTAVVGAEPPLPNGFNPCDPAFATAMAAWQSQMVPLLRDIDSKATVEVMMETAVGVKVRLPITPAARRMITSGRFGEDYRHAAIYLQAVACEQGANLTIDGQVGNGTRRALQALLQRLDWRGDLDQYDRFLRDYFGRGLPLSLQPGNAAFRREMQAWWQRIVPAIEANTTQVTWQPDYRDKTIQLRLGDVALKRLQKSNFGDRRSDELIYLQFLARSYGAPLVVDGQYGPNTERALGRLMAETYRRPADERSYQRSLAGRF